MGADYISNDGTEWKAVFIERNGHLNVSVFANGKYFYCAFLGKTATLSDELQDQIPWDAIRSDIQSVAMLPDGNWYGWEGAPMLTEGNAKHWLHPKWNSNYPKSLEAVNMPEVNSDRWKETLVKRP